MDPDFSRPSTQTKISSRFCSRLRFTSVRANNVDRNAALKEAELYYSEHPGSPSAVRRPRLSVRSGVWIALLGRSLQEGIAGFGPTVERALCAFDVQYRSTLRLQNPNHNAQIPTKSKDVTRRVENPNASDFNFQDGPLILFDLGN